MRDRTKCGDHRISLEREKRRTPSTVLIVFETAVMMPVRWIRERERERISMVRMGLETQQTLVAMHTPAAESETVTRRRAKKGRDFMILKCVYEKKTYKNETLYRPASTSCVGDKPDPTATDATALSLPSLEFSPLLP